MVRYKHEGFFWDVQQWFGRHYRLICVLVILIYIILSLELHYIMTHIICDQNLTRIEVFALNTRGPPRKNYSNAFDDARMEAIGDEVAQGIHDLYLFQELWMRADYARIRSKLPKGFSITDYSALSEDRCDGVETRKGCSGLAIVSKYPIEATSFHAYQDCVKKNSNGQCILGRGVGRIRIRPLVHDLSVTVDVFVTQTVPDAMHHNYSHVRNKQAHQLVEVLKASDADAILMGVSLHAAPNFNPGIVYLI